MPFNSGFDLAEALDLLALSAIVEGGDDVPSEPAGWNLIFDSAVIGPFTDRWQLWKNASGFYAIVLRGTVLDAGSILEDLISFLAPANGRVTVGHVQIDYSFAANSNASVHFGFALGTLFLLKDPTEGILVQLANRVSAGSAVYIAGHSQGAAMATLLRSYLEYGSDAPKDKKYSYKTYAYAQPKPGNDHYAADFGSKFCNSGLAFRISNSLDWVPQMPFTIELPGDINRPNPLSILTNPRLAMITAALKPLFDTVHADIVDHTRQRLQPKAAALAQRVSSPARASQLMPLNFDVAVTPSLNFVNAATDVSLIGTPCVDAQCQDAFFEHHATTYYALMQAQLPVA
jgi:hypothetical protein